MRKIVILTGNELRHQYFRTLLSNDGRFSVATTFCEGLEKSLETRTNENPESSELEKLHVKARNQSEIDFFSSVVEHVQDKSNPVFIKKGDINTPQVVEAINEQKPDLIICYGSSLIKSSLLQDFKGKFLNVHLGLSPYYRGSGTNIWPLINKEPWMVGATFMYIDEGIDTGNIIHQIRADVFLGDSPHTIGNRLIRKMSSVYCDLIVNFDQITMEDQPQDQGKLYLRKDYDAQACYKLYQNFKSSMIEDYITQNKAAWPYIVSNKALEVH